MTDKILGTIPSFVFDNSHIIGLPKKWNLNTNKPIEFLVKVTGGILILSASLEELSDKIRNDDNNVSTDQL